MSNKILIFCDLLDFVAPKADDIVVIIKSYFDESYDNDLLCVAGYSFTSAKARLLDDEWRKMLARYGRLPYFRMSACNTNQKPLDRLTPQQCIDIATEAIRIINQYAGLGYAVTINKKSFREVIGNKGFISTPYELCVWLCLVAVRMEFGPRFSDCKMSFFL